ncbi:MAG: hypothetical protein HW382_204 [Deltaproteobacteria bacterium]|nr:hypothetical protein [Deltaproteobacteria bacterium]
MLAVTYVFFLGLTQTGILFAAIMRMSKSSWGRHFSRLGEILTLSFFPVAIITLLIIYFGGVDHLFYWASPHVDKGGHHLSPWLGKGPFLFRNLVAMGLFYGMSFIYFRAGRIEENETPVSDTLDKKLNVMSGFVMVFYVIANTEIAWDFGMMIIPHWESTIFPAYWWVGNKEQGKVIDKEHLDQFGKLLLSFALLWVYMFWSQHIVVWYSDLPNITGPLITTMKGNYTSIFVIMILAAFIIPFFALIYRSIKLSVPALATVALIICLGIWINRYLMIIPVFTDGGAPLFATWTGISLILAGLSSTLLSIILFFRLYPNIKRVTSFRSDY